jgi:hypothetical protein
VRHDFSHLQIFFDSGINAYSHDVFNDHFNLNWYLNSKNPTMASQAAAKRRAEAERGPEAQQQREPASL